MTSDPVTTTHQASRAELQDILGDIDERQAILIMTLRPTVAQIEEAAVWAAGDGDLLAREGRPLEGKVAAIFDILTADEDEEAGAPRASA